MYYVNTIIYYNRLNTYISCTQPSSSCTSQNRLVLRHPKVYMDTRQRRPVRVWTTLKSHLVSQPTNNSLVPGSLVCISSGSLLQPPWANDGITPCLLTVFAICTSAAPFSNRICCHLERFCVDGSNKANILAVPQVDGFLHIVHMHQYRE